MIRDANNVIAELVYHPRGWLQQQIVRGANDAATTDDQITTYATDARGNVTRVTTPDNRYADLTYDSRDRLTKIRDQGSNELRYSYDSAGNPESSEAWATIPSASRKRRQTFTVDLLDRVIQTTGSTAAQLTAVVYDAAGRQTNVTDPNLVQSTQVYNDLDRLIATVADSASGGLQATTGMAYDAVGHLRSVVDPKGLATTYTYDALGRMTQQVSPDSDTTSATYDDAGNALTKTDARGITTTYTYDALNRPLTVVYPTAAENVAYVYDTSNALCQSGETFAIGRLSRMTDHSGTTEYCYDRFGNTVRKVQTVGGQAREVRYSYDLANQPTSLTYPDGSVVDYTRDTQGRVQEIGVTVMGGTRQVLLTTAKYLPAGPATSWQYGNGRTLSRSYDEDYRATGVRDAGVGGLDIGYVYDNASYLKQITTQSTAVVRAKFEYDALGRMTARKDNANVVQESYTYDTTGNRLTTTLGATTTTNTYPATSHRLTQVGAVARTYDSAGNLTAIGGTTKEFVYNDANRMSVAKANTVVQGTYLYNGFGEQVQRQTSVTTRFVYDEAGQLLGQYDSTGNALQQYVWLEGHAVGVLVAPSQAATPNARLKYVETDALGTPRAIIDPSRQLAIWRWDEMKEGFGDHAPNTDPDGDSTQLVFDLRFPGQRYDQASGLHYNYQRDYDPATGRNTQSDPIGLAGGISTYGYVGGNPMNGIDRLGLTTIAMPAPSSTTWFPDVSWLTRAREWLVYGLEFGTSRAATGTFGIGLLIFSSEIGYSSCEAPGVDFNQCIARTYPRPAAQPFPIIMTNESSDADDCPWTVPQGALDKIPSTWGQGVPNSKAIGTKWKDPENPKGNIIRIDKGNPKSSFPTQQVDHVVIISGGVVIGMDGNPINGTIKQYPVESHIPLTDWSNWSSWNKP
jgi:RHS repeat-associated protein